MDAERLDRIIEAVKDELTAGPVCDSMFKCAGWERMQTEIMTHSKDFRYCPFCGNEIVK